MIINDILKKEEFSKLNKFLDHEMEKYAGNVLIRNMVHILGNRENARDWFYTPRSALEGKRPYDLCKGGESKQVKQILGQIEHGIYS